MKAAAHLWILIWCSMHECQVTKMFATWLLLLGRCYASLETVQAAGYGCCCAVTDHCCSCRSALFPIPIAFEATGIIAALVAMIIVAAATIYTVELLMAEASACGMHDYGTLSKAIGGTWYKVKFQTCGLHWLRGSCSRRHRHTGKV